MSKLRTAKVLAILAVSSLFSGIVVAEQVRAQSCTPLQAIGGGTVVSKTIQLDGPLVFPFGRTNFNTDFSVDTQYRNYLLKFESTSKKPGPYPILAFFKFSDETNLQIVNETLDASPGQAKEYGLFTPPAEKLVTQVNVKVGSGLNANATGFSYKISVMGCK